MHPNKLFLEQDLTTLAQRIQNYPFGLILAVSEDGRPKVAHAPVLVEKLEDKIYIRFHLARQNRVSEALLNNSNCVCVFSGPDAYISPDWYGIPNQVPTWNYLSVECEGVAGHYTQKNAAIS